MRVGDSVINIYVIYIIYTYIHIYLYMHTYIRIYVYMYIYIKTNLRRKKEEKKKEFLHSSLLFNIEVNKMRSTCISGDLDRIDHKKTK